MLSLILDQFDRAHQPLCLDEIAQNLNAEPAAVEARLELLVQMGRLLEVGGAEACSSCPVRSGCYLVPAARRTFLLASRQAGKLQPPDPPGSARQLDKP